MNPKVSWLIAFLLLARTSHGHNYRTGGFSNSSTNSVDSVGEFQGWTPVTSLTVGNNSAHRSYRPSRGPSRTFRHLEFSFSASPTEESPKTDEQSPLLERTLVIQSANLSSSEPHGPDQESHLSLSRSEADRFNGSVAHDSDNQPPKPPFPKPNRKRPWDSDFDDMHDFVQNSRNLTWTYRKYASQAVRDSCNSAAGPIKYPITLVGREILKDGEDNWLLEISAAVAASLWFWEEWGAERKKKKRRTSSPGQPSTSFDQQERRSGPRDSRLRQASYYGFPPETRTSLEVSSKSLACFQCWKMKQKCDRKEKTCSRCVKINYDCGNDRGLLEKDRGYEIMVGSMEFLPKFYDINHSFLSPRSLDLVSEVEIIYQKFLQFERNCLEEYCIHAGMSDRKSRAVTGLYWCVSQLKYDLSTCLKDQSHYDNFQAQYIHYFISHLQMVFQSLYSEHSLRRLSSSLTKNQTAIEDVWLDCLAKLSRYCKDIKDEGGFERKSWCLFPCRWDHHKALDSPRDMVEHLILKRSFLAISADESKEKMNGSMIEYFSESSDGGASHSDGSEDNGIDESIHDNLETSYALPNYAQEIGLGEILGGFRPDVLDSPLRPEPASSGKPQEISELMPRVLLGDDNIENHPVPYDDVSNTPDDDWLSSFMDLEKFSLDFLEYDSNSTSFANMLDESEPNTQPGFSKHSQLDPYHNMGYYVDPCLTVMSQWNPREDPLQGQNTNHESIAQNPLPPATRSKGDPITCPQCLKSFARPSDLKKHTKSHSRPVRCLEQGCNYNCATEKELRRHQNCRHVEGRKTQRETCPAEGCEITFSRRDNLLRHLRGIHKESLNAGVKA